MLCIKEWAMKENTIEEFIQLLEEIHAIIFELSDNCTPLIKRLGVERDGITQVISIQNFHGQFCRLIFNYASKMIGQKGNVKDIPWILLFKTILKNANGSSLLNLMDCFVLAKFVTIQFYFYILCTGLWCSG